MKKSIGIWIYGVSIFVLLGVACLAGGLNSKKLTCTTTSGNVTNSTTSVRGWIERIEIDFVTALTTSDVDVVYSPELSTLSDITLYSANDVDADTIVYPRIDTTDTAGSALTTDPPARFAACGGTIKLITSNSDQTNRVINAQIIYEYK